MSLRSPSVRLRQAVQDDDLALVMRLRGKTDLRNTDSNRLTSLAYAALFCAEEVFEWLLLDAGHDDEELSRDTDNSTILHMLASLPAPMTPRKKKLSEIHRSAVRMGNMYFDAFPYLMDWSSAGGKTALHIAAQSGNVEFVKTLCELGADLNLPDLQGNTPLHYASAWNQIAVIHVLIAFPDCDMTARNNSNFTPLDYSYSNALYKEFSAAIKETTEDRRSKKSQQPVHSPVLGQGGPGNSIRNGSFVSAESSGMAVAQLGNRGSMFTLPSEEATGGNHRGGGDVIRYDGRSGVGTLPLAGLIDGVYADRDTYVRLPLRRDSTTSSQQMMVPTSQWDVSSSTEQEQEQEEGVQGIERGVTSEMGRLQVRDGGSRV